VHAQCEWRLASDRTHRTVASQSAELDGQQARRVDKPESSDAFTNAPVALQVATRRWEDEKLFAVLARINEVWPL
jgi:Asp-tRNA(Asn)/Glu-tRNA(Gln) amidotransferase A subunit family amidase